MKIDVNKFNEFFGQFWGKHCTYVIAKTDGEIYVGTSSNLLRRLFDHGMIRGRKGFHNITKIVLSIEVFDTAKEAHQHEKQLMHELNKRQYLRTYRNAQPIPVVPIETFKRKKRHSLTKPYLHDIHVP